MGNQCFKSAADCDDDRERIGIPNEAFREEQENASPIITRQRVSPQATDRPPIVYSGDVSGEMLTEALHNAHNSIPRSDCRFEDIQVEVEEEYVSDEIDNLDDIVEVAEQEEEEAMVETGAEGGGETSAAPLVSSTNSRVEPRRFANFPFFIKRHFNWISRNRTMFVMRGLPGSGKSTLVEILREKFPTARVCSADNFWVRPDGSYQFDISRLSEAHSRCHTATFNACEAGENPLVIDNTNVSPWEYKYYVDIAKKFNYVVVMVIPKTPWRFDIGILSQRNRHKVPVDVLQKKLRKFNTAVPLYFGWFLGSCFQERLAKIGWRALDQMMADSDIRRRFIEDLGLSKNIPRADLTRNRYTPTGSLLHVTAKFCDRGRAPGSLQYVSNNMVTDALGRVDQLEATGFVLTPRTLGIRVTLGKPSLSLWDGLDNEGLPGSSKKRGGAQPPCADGQKTGRTKGCRAHVTLGVARGVGAVQTGLDQLDVSDLEWQKRGAICGKISLGDVTYFGEARFYVQLKSPFRFQALFSGEY